MKLGLRKINRTYAREQNSNYLIKHKMLSVKDEYKT